MTLNVQTEWRSHLDDIVADPGVTVVVGDVDVGKTTFCAVLANHALQAGVSAAVVDGDIGQSEIGPPTTVGLGIVESPIRTISELTPRELFFVGSTSPEGHSLALAAGDVKLAENAQSRGCQLVIVDTTGMVRGLLGRRLKTHKIQLLRPRHIVALQKAREAEHFLRLFDTWEGCTVHRLSPSPDVRAKSPTLRAQRRAVRFREYFQGGESHDIPLPGLVTSGTWLHTGSPLEPKYLKFAERAMGVPVYHGETVDKSVFLVTEGNNPPREGKGLQEIQEYFKTRSIIAIPAGRYQNLLVGLQDSRLDLLGLGIIRGIDFRSGIMSVHTPLRSLMPMRSVSFGVLRLRPDGTQIVRLRPGDT